MNLNNKLFPEIPPTSLTINHFRFLDLLLRKKELSQKRIIEELKINKTTISEIKDDFVRLGWCNQINFGNGKELNIKIKKKSEILKFLGQWKSIKQSIFVRPHSIEARGIIEDNVELKRTLISKFSQEYQVIISQMRNNEQYTISTEFGKIIFYLKGGTLRYTVDGFILPIKQEDLELFNTYIQEGINDRINNINKILKEYCGDIELKINNLTYLKSLHLGIITEKDTSKIIKIKSKIKEWGMFSDGSIGGCDEIEISGRVNEILSKGNLMLNCLFEQNE